MKIEALERELPPATLLLGPDVGPMLTAAYRSALKTHLVCRADVLIRRHMSAGDARFIVKFAQTAPFGTFKVVAFPLDGATAQAQNILLKVLEEPPPTVRFILVASARPLPTIVSRCQVIIVAGEVAPQVSAQKVTAQVTAAMNAANAGDLRGLDVALAGWGDAQHAALTDRASDAAIAGQQEARRLLGALGRFSGAHPRLAAHAALISVLGDKEHHA